LEATVSTEFNEKCEILNDEAPTRLWLK
jgi:hypothetical protein